MYPAYLNANGIPNVDLYRSCISLDVITRLVSQFVASKFGIDRGLRRWCPNQTQTCAACAQTFTYKLWWTTWTYGEEKKLLKSKHLSALFPKTSRKRDGYPKNTKNGSNGFSFQDKSSE